MAVLFEATRIGSLSMANRFVRSATWEGLADDHGAVTPRLIDMVCKLASGGVGLIITGHAFVSPEGRALKLQTAIYSDDFLPGLSQMAASVHDLGGKIVVQLAHAGAHGRTGEAGAMGPSETKTDTGLPIKEMTPVDMEAVTKAFALAAARAEAAGYDGVQIHGAHGYLFSQFLSPFFNKRTDEYGGSLENRARLLVKVVRAIRKAVSPGYPVFVKINAEDFLEGGLTAEDMLKAATMLEKSGVSAIEMSGGTFLSGKNIPSRKGKPAAGDPEAYYENTAKRFKERVGLPLMLVGGIRTIETAERLVRENVADYISLCRPLIREPGLVNRWKSGDRNAATCVFDNRCFVSGFEGRGISCMVEERKKGEK
jgi:2,4-dienoyl-CoA reductase-like NADH-dependent reductase (Old Yellow Enzyme family)